MINYTYPESGYTPANLFSAMRSCCLGKEDIAVLMNVKPDAVTRWLSDLKAKRQRDMSVLAWKELQAKLELLFEIRRVLVDEHLVYSESHPDSQPTLRINKTSDGYHVTCGTPPGNAYPWQVGEYFCGIGLTIDSIDWQSAYEAHEFDPDNEDRDEDEYDRISQEITTYASDAHMQENICSWVNEAFDYFETETETETA